MRCSGFLQCKLGIAPDGERKGVGARHPTRPVRIVVGFAYEWRKSDRQPFAVGIANDDLMVMAGLWDQWKSPAGERIKSCTVITCQPNATVGFLHDRMPVILDERDWPKWLGEESATEDELKALLVPCPDERLSVWPVHRKVGNVRNDGRDLAEPVVSQPSLPGM